MENKIVHNLSDEESKKIEELYEKKLAFENLIKIVDGENEKIYNKLISDYGNLLKEYNIWWDSMRQKYEWEGSNWRVDFDNKTIVLVEN